MAGLISREPCADTLRAILFFLDIQNTTVQKKDMFESILVFVLAFARDDFILT